MTSSSDRVVISGSATFKGASESGSLTDGTLEVAKDFVQQHDVSTSSFVASGSHTVKLSGNGTQNITFIDPTVSKFKHLEVTNTSPTTVTFATNATIDGTLTARKDAHVKTSSASFKSS